MPIDLDPTVAKAAPGVVGSAIAMWRLTGVTWWQRLTSFAAGAATSYWGADVVAKAWPTLNKGFAGFVLGLFGMALIAKGFETLEQLRPAELLRDFFTGKKG